ncbi:MAG: Vitamin B12 transporter BtuB [Pseudomonadales bacterium]|nr:Vitamin B12 transporter BtuB [Pseudomonadales bacterium]
MNHSTYQRKALFAGIVGASALLLGSTASAQDQDITSLGIEEMVVTAQKREENLQAVPISISTLSATDIERRGVQNPRDLLFTMPGVGGFEPPGGKGSMSTSMRGVSAGSPANLSNDTTTAMYIDGVLIGKMVGTALDVAELERVEVLRGPQGTLYGRNSTGGAINFITSKPSGEFGGKITGSVGNEGLWGVRASIDTPTLGTEGEGLGTLKASLGAQTRKRDGFQDNTTAVQKDFDNMDRQALRAALRWEPNDAITVDYAFDHSELDERNPLQSLVGLTAIAVDPATGALTDRMTALNGYIAAGDAAVNFGAGPLAAAATDPTFARWLNSAKALKNTLANINSPGNRPDEAGHDAYSGTKNEAEGHSLTAAWQFDDLGALGSVEFKSITAWREVDARNVGDLDGIDNTMAPGGVGALNDNALGAMYSLYAAQGQFPSSFLSFPRATMAKLWGLVDEFGGGGFTQDAAFEYEQFSQELQMVGSTERLQYAVGLYWFEDEGMFDNYRLAAVPVGGILTSTYENDTEAKAFYSQFTYTPAILDDRLAVTVGYRYTEETKGVEYLYTDDGSSTGNGLFIPTAACTGLNQAYLCVNQAYDGKLSPTPTYGDSFEDDFSNHSGGITLAYQATDSTNVFVRWSTGYRSGGFNGEIYNNPFEEETMEQWELGVKSDVVPGTLRVNASVFQYTYEDMQVSQIQVNAQGQPTSFIGNAGEADRWGSEIELQWSPTDNLLVAASWAHLEGDFEKFPALCGTGAYANVCRTDTADLAQRAQSADDQLSLVTDWVFLSTDWADFMAHVEVFWQDEIGTSALWTNNYRATGGTYPYIYEPIILKDRTLVNARIGMENVELSNGTSLRASLWANNVFDKEYNTFGINFGSLGVITEQYGAPRTYGLDVIWEF